MIESLYTTHLLQYNQLFVYISQESIKTILATNVWQISRNNLRLLTVLGEGNFGKVCVHQSLNHLYMCYH